MCISDCCVKLIRVKLQTLEVKEATKGKDFEKVVRLRGR